MKHAFYGGAGTLLYALMNAVSAGDDVTVGDISVLQTVNAELDEFAAASRQPQARPN